MLISQLSTLKSPLLLCSLCYFIALEKSGWTAGLLSIVASVLLVLLMGFLRAMLQNIVFFAPYAVIAFLLRRKTYAMLASAAIRLAVMTAFSLVVLLICYFFANTIFPEIDFSSIKGGVTLLALLTPVLIILTDFLFIQVCQSIKRLIK